MKLLANVYIKRIPATLNYSTKSTRPNKPTNFSYCIDVVKSTDYNTYLSTLIVPQPYLRPAFAVKAFNTEIIQIGHSKYDQRISQIKLQFWKDQLDKIFKASDSDKSLSEPISNELLAVIKQFNLTKPWFSRLVEARKQFLNGGQIKTLADLEKYADAQMASVFYILLNCLNVKNPESDHVASHLSKTIMISNVVRNILRPNSQSVHSIPMDLLVKHKISQQDLINLSAKVLKPKQQNLKDLAFEMCTRANQHLNSARDLADKVPKEARPIFASSFAYEVFLNKMESFDFDLMNPKVNSDFRLQFLLKLVKGKLRSSF